MGEADRIRWDDRHSEYEPLSVDSPRLPTAFAGHVVEFPTAGRALELACGRGATSVWLASRGLDVWGVDVSPVAIGQARRLATSAGVSERCRFEVFDLDDGLPDGPSVDLLLSHMYRASGLERQMVERLAPGGLLAMAVLSEAGSGPGRFRARTGELGAMFAELELVAEGEGEGRAWLLARSVELGGR